MHKNLIFFGAAILLGFNSTFAIPARKTVIEGFMADGAPVKAVQYGDENFHYYISESDGALLLRDGEVFITADFNANGALAKSENSVSARKLSSRLHGAASTAPRRVPGLVPSASFPTKGNQKVAVILVEYQDVKFNLSDPMDYFSRMLNEENFSDYWATGSARDWFINSSYGQFVPEFVVMGPVTLQNVRSYYGGNDAFGQDDKPQKMAIEACRKLNPDVDFSQFDCDNDGYIDNIFIVYAGRGEASGGSSDCVWPHAWTIAGAEPGATYSFDGVRLNRYACTNEWEISDQGRGYRPQGIGPFVHEFSHVMGLPDLYSTAYNAGTFTPGAWSAMDYGPYNNDCCTPPQFSAWERASLGYLDIKELPVGAANVAINRLEDGEAYIVPTDKPNEFFILENRQQNGWDSFIPGHGMLVWHIDYDSDVWRQNIVNNDPSHNYVDIIEAAGELKESARAYHSFPGLGNVTALSASTTPALKSWSGKSTGLSLSDISELDGRLVFRLNGGAADIASPSKTEVVTTTPASFTVSWPPVDNATGYFLRLYDEDKSLMSSTLIDAEDNQFTFSGLSPQTSYYFTVSTDDGFYGSLPTEAVLVTTDDPTLDYFTLFVYEPENITDTSFLAKWDPLEGVGQYTVELFNIAAGEVQTLKEDFSDGADNLSNGFSTNSPGSYGMAAYAGEAIPSLRLSADGDFLLIDAGEKYIESLSFWHRGNSTGDSESIVIEGLDGDISTPLENIPVEKTVGGIVTTVKFDQFAFHKAKIVFNRVVKGALALDDVVVETVDKIDCSINTYYADPTATQLQIEGLTPATTYKYSVTGSDGIFTTKESERVEFTTAVAGGIVDVESSYPRVLVDNLDVICDQHVLVTDIYGRIVASGTGRLHIGRHGVYIIKSNNSQAIKIIL